MYTWEKENCDKPVDIGLVDVAITDAGEQYGVRTVVVKPLLICKSLSLYIPLS